MHDKFLLQFLIFRNLPEKKLRGETLKINLKLYVEEITRFNSLIILVKVIRKIIDIIFRVLIVSSVFGQFSNKGWKLNIFIEDKANTDLGAKDQKDFEQDLKYKRWPVADYKLWVNVILKNRTWQDRRGRASIWAQALRIF